MSNYVSLSFNLWLLIFIVFLFTTNEQVKAQGKEDQAADLMEVFIDCQGGCDINYIRQEIDYVNHVRDQLEAQVHVFITRQYSSSGGHIYDLSFTGRNDYEGINNQFQFIALTTETEDEIRKGLTKSIERGLVSYLVHTDLGEKLDISLKEKPTNKNQATGKDPWRNWLFDIYANGSLDEEQNRKRFVLRSGLEADRVTEEWRVGTNLQLNFDELKVFADSSNIIYRNTHRHSLNSRVVKSMGDHWSSGLSGGFYTSTYSNLKERYYLGPALEYSLFPYSQVLRREITLAYRVSYSIQNYYEESIFNKLGDTFGSQSITLNVRYRQPWGSIYSSIRGSHFLKDINKNRLEINNNSSVRIFKGLSVRINVNFKIIGDQIYLPKGEASLEDVLLQQKQVATAYDLYVGGGLSYTFGSIYNNVLNTRL
ncbi:MAG: hypothetical protein OEX02_17380 [Cyclobacteriaceae bacterium]|nr:hypothetical protein [Cyclobacteriaceae bacterium]